MLTDLVEWYNDWMERGDPRTKDWLLVYSPWPNVLLVILYIYVVKYAGPQFMKNREPYNIRTFMVLYNFAMVILSMHMVYEFLFAGWLTPEYSIFGCQPVNYSNDPNAIRIAKACWWYFFSKYIEFLDTIFFVLRKKQSHVSFLHVFHHGSLPMFLWVGIKTAPGGFATMFGLLNTSVHSVMYLYYGIAALGPKYHKYLWWKKYMTIYQLVQFVLMFVHSIQQFFVSECNYPLFLRFMIPIFASFFFYLFIGFFLKEYMKPKTTQLKDQQNGVTHNNGVTNGNISLNGGSLCYQPVNNNYDGIKTRSMSNGLKTD